MAFAHTEYERAMRGMDEYKCGDCFHANLCEKSKMLVGFSRDNPAYCGMFLNSADVSTVKHGRWDDSGRYVFPGGSIAVRCSECGCSLTASEYKLNKWNYCPVCGAKMDGECGD